MKSLLEISYSTQTQLPHMFILPNLEGKVMFSTLSSLKLAPSLAFDTIHIKLFSMARLNRERHPKESHLKSLQISHIQT